MRRCFQLLLPLVLMGALLLMLTSVSAQTVADGVMTGEQDYLLLATISDITDNAIVVEPYHCIVWQDENGQALDSILPTGDAIAIEKFRYSYCIEHADSFNTPKLGDNIFISLSRQDGAYVMQNGAFKTDTVDYKILTFLAPAGMRDQECMDDLVALSYFVRTDGKVTAFSYDGGTVRVVKDGRELTLYPSDKVKEWITFVADNGKVVEGSKPVDVITDQQMPHELPADYRWLIALGVLAFGLVLGGIVLSVLLRRDGRRQFKKINRVKGE